MNLEIIASLKLAMKAKGVTYGQLATHLGVSEQTIKRLFREKDCSLSRLDAICQFLEISVCDLFTFAQDYQAPTTRLSAEQERYLSQRPDHFSFLFFLCVGHSLDHIQRTYGLDDVSVFRYLRDLDQQGFLVLSANNHYVLNIEGALLMRLDSDLAPLVLKLNQLCLSHAMRHNQRHGFGFDSSFRRMSESTLQKMRADYDALTEQYRKMAWQDETLLPASQLVPVKWSVLMANFDPCGHWPLNTHKSVQS